MACNTSNNFWGKIEVYERVSYLFVEQGVWVMLREVMGNIDLKVGFFLFDGLVLWVLYVWAMLLELQHGNFSG